MHTQVDTIPVTMQARRLPEFFHLHSHSHFPVCDSHGHLKGVLSFSDFTAFAKKHPSSHYTVKDIMRKQVSTTFERQDLYSAFSILAEHKLKNLPVLRSQEDPTVTGILSSIDILRSYNRKLHFFTSPVEEGATGRASAPAANLEANSGPGAADPTKKEAP